MLDDMQQHGEVVQVIAMMRAQLDCLAEMQLRIIMPATLVQQDAVPGPVGRN